MSSGELCSGGAVIPVAELGPHPVMRLTRSAGTPCPQMPSRMGSRWGKAPIRPAITQIDALVRPLTSGFMGIVYDSVRRGALVGAVVDSRFAGFRQRCAAH